MRVICGLWTVIVAVLFLYQNDLFKGGDGVMGEQGITYHVDLVLCIDQTGSMGSIIERVKKEALNFQKDIFSRMDEMGKRVDKMRVKVIGFRDYYYDDCEPMIESDFLVLPDDNTKFEDFVNNLDAIGGGDDPESGLEALAKAIRSPWKPDGDKNRQVIVIWTDTGVHPLGDIADQKNYPANMPKDLAELRDWWEGQDGFMDSRSKRLLVYAPDSSEWSEIGREWDSALFFPSVAGGGLEEATYGEIINVICRSLS
jgi:hypothetical protein